MKTIFPANLGGAIYNSGTLTLSGTNTFFSNENHTGPNDIYNVDAGCKIYVIDGTTTLNSGLTNKAFVTVSGGTGNGDGTVSGTTFNINRLVNTGIIKVNSGILVLTGTVEAAGNITIGDNYFNDDNHTGDELTTASLKTIDAVLNINTDMDDASFLSRKICLI